MTSSSGNSDHQSPDGRPGDYFFTDLAHLDTIIARWSAIQAQIRRNGANIEQAAQTAAAPAADPPSSVQADTYTTSLYVAYEHSVALADYVGAHIDRLTASQASYRATEEDNAHRFPLPGN